MTNHNMVIISNLNFYFQVRKCLVKPKKVSKVKVANQKKNKKVRPGKQAARLAKKKDKGSFLSNDTKSKKDPVKKKKQQTQPQAPVPEEVEEDDYDQGEDMLGMVEDDDLEYIKKSITERSYHLLKQIRSSAEYVS